MKELKLIKLENTSAILVTTRNKATANSHGKIDNITTDNGLAERNTATVYGHPQMVTFTSDSG